MTDHGTPEGYTSPTPFLCIADGAAAITFYCPDADAVFDRAVAAVREPEEGERRLAEWSTSSLS